MSVDRQQAIDYVRAPHEGLWRWAEEGAVLVWQDGGTIAFREEVERILEWLAPNALPPFGAIVLLLAAARGELPDLDRIAGASEELPAGPAGNAAAVLSVRASLRKLLGKTLQQLTKVPQLPKELRTGLKARCVLAEVVFETVQKDDFVDGGPVLRGLREPMTDQDLIGSHTLPLWKKNREVISQIQILADGLGPHTADTLALRLKTGLDALPDGSKVELDLAAAERVRGLIEELSRDREFGAVARAARELMAAVRLPRRLARREQLAIGGVADITNRGSLDRLLLSELAQDDLTLSLRVALNEALYLRREPPMREPPGALVLLLDSGIRLWGVPRVLATAVALALIARDRRQSEVRVWRPSGQKLIKADLMTRGGLTLHLAALEIDEHPGESLEAFAKGVEADERNQSVLVTHRDTLDDPAFRRALAQHPAAPDFVASVDHSGRFELHALPLAHRPPVCQARLNLGSIFGDGPGVPLIDPGFDPNLPAIHHVRPFPLLLPLRGKPAIWSRGQDGLIAALLTDQRLVQFRDNLKGGRILAPNLPGGTASWMECVDDVIHLVKPRSKKGPARLLSFPLPGGPVRAVALTAEEKEMSVHRYGGVILLLGHRLVLAIALSDGRELARATPSVPYFTGRFYQSDMHFYFASWDGQAIQFERVTLPSRVLKPSVKLIFDREGEEGPWLLLAWGEIVNTATGERSRPAPITTDVLFGTVSRDGHRISIVDRHSHPQQVYDLLSGESFTSSGFPHGGLETEPLLPGWKVLRVLNAVARLPDGIAVLGRNNRWRKVCLTGPEQVGIADARPEELEGLAPVSFDKRLKADPRGGTFKVAEWPNGSRAFLDTNGGLHLKSHDPGIAEVSLLLSDGAVAGWTSAGDMCGPGFFLDTPHISQPVAVFRRLMAFVSNL